MLCYHSHLQCHNKFKRKNRLWVFGKLYEHIYPLKKNSMITFYIMNQSFLSFSHIRFPTDIQEIRIWKTGNAVGKLDTSAFVVQKKLEESGKE